MSERAGIRHHIIVPVARPAIREVNVCLSNNYRPVRFAGSKEGFLHIAMVIIVIADLMHEPMATQIFNRTVTIDGVAIFYREAGDAAHPSLLLLHGFPSSSVMFKNLMIALSDRFHLVAPDFPGFGFSAFPGTDRFEYTFANISKYINRLTEEIGLDSYTVYLHDYGCAVGLLLCINHPEKIEGIIVQSGNAHEEGLGPQWDEVRDYWQHPIEEKKKKIYAFLSEEGTKMQYFTGFPKKLLPTVSPELWMLDWELLKRPGNIDMQYELNCDYKSHIDLFPKFHDYFNVFQPPALVMWGKYDIFFDVEEVHAYKKNLPDAQVQILEGGHMALETNFSEITTLIENFLARQGSGQSRR